MRVTAKIIRDCQRRLVRVDTCFVYDGQNPHDTEKIRMDKILEEHPDYVASYFVQSGPCSNWGYDILRKETDEEYLARLQKEKELIKRISGRMVKEISQ